MNAGPAVDWRPARGLPDAWVRVYGAPRNGLHVIVEAEHDEAAEHGEVMGAIDAATPAPLRQALFMGTYTDRPRPRTGRQWTSHQYRVTDETYGRIFPAAA